MLQLLLPALIPSWRFFDRIGPAPRVEHVLLGASGGRQTTGPEPGTDTSGPRWREVHPRPATVSPLAMLRRLFWNPRRNEALYLVSCAEALLEDPSPARAAHLWEQVAGIVRAEHRATGPDTRLQIRVIVTGREPGHDRKAGRQGGAGAASASTSGSAPGLAPGAAPLPESGRLVEQVAYQSEARLLGPSRGACAR
ncbi:MAG: hypothetical protein AB7G23_00935 [Vicinamibacterales bacterium]